MKTVLITGSSTGIGKTTALYFQKKGWNVIATMRTPEKEVELKKLDNVLCVALDVTKPETIKNALQEGITHFGGIDVIVNNAGYGLNGPFEATDREQVEKQFATNVFGLMDVVREIIPYFRSKTGDTIINVASMGGRLAFLLYSVYHASKWAVDGFSESLQFELLPFNIAVKIVEPGAIKTDFYDRSADVAKKPGLNAYDAYVNKAMSNMSKSGANGTSPQAVAETIYKAATDRSGKLRFPVGANAKTLLFMRRIISDKLYSKIVRSQVLK